MTKRIPVTVLGVVKYRVKKSQWQTITLQFIEGVSTPPCFRLFPAIARSLREGSSRRFTFTETQNCLARSVVKAPKSSLITPILRSLHWLKINERIEYKLLSLTYNVLTTTKLTTYTILSLFSLCVKNLLLIRCYPCSTICIFLIINHQPLFHICITLPVDSAPFFIPSTSFCSLSS